MKTKKDLITNKEYAEGVMKTESCDFDKIRERMSDENIRLLHTAQGLATEAGEFNDMIKKHIFYGKELDKINLIEELGDLYWYLNVAQDVLGVITETVQKRNNMKLMKRYNSGKFSEKNAIERNLSIEREALEGK